MATIPNFERAVVEPGKLAGYLLNLNHSKGGSKAKFFLANGFSSRTLEQALRAHADGAEAIVRTTPFTLSSGPLTCRPAVHASCDPFGRSETARLFHAS